MVKETTEAVAPETLSVVEVPHVVLVVISVVIVIAVTQTQFNHWLRTSMISLWFCTIPPNSLFMLSEKNIDLFYKRSFLLTNSQIENFCLPVCLILAIGS